MSAVYDPLIERWWTPPGVALAEEVHRFLLGHRSLPEEVGFHEGYADLRGFGFPPLDQNVAPIGTIHVEGLRWDLLDLSGARLPRVRAVGVTIRECRFDGADCRHWRLERTEVVDSTFIGADLSRSTHEGTVHAATQFDRAKMRRSRVLGGAMTGCTLHDAALDESEFVGPEMRNCVISGQVGRVLFDGRRRINVAALMAMTDLTKADLSRVEFVGYRFEQVEVPGGMVVLDDYPRVLAQAAETLRDATDPNSNAVRALIDQQSVAGWAPDSSGLIDPASLREDLGESAADLVMSLLLGSTKESRADTVQVETALSTDAAGLVAGLIGSRGWEPPGLAQSDVVDLVAQSPLGQAVLFIVERRPWVADAAQGTRLVAKVNHYIRYLADSGLQRDYPSLADLPVVFRLECADEPTTEIRAMIEQVRAELAPANVGFDVQVDATLSVEPGVSPQASSGKIEPSDDSREA